MVDFPDIGIEPYYEDKWHRIYLGDCRAVVLSLSGISAVITDPPYELGFMGKSWDSRGVSFQPLTWEVIKGACTPGAMLLSFGGTRTWHRIAVAIEDAGWEIRDTVMWVYGCLSEDTEVLTLRGYIPFHKLTLYDIILVYDSKRDIYKWETPERWSVYRVYKDTAYRITSDSTDQLVSRNHNCLVEREGELVLCKAEDLADMETMPVLPSDIPDKVKIQRDLLLSTVQWRGERAGVEVSCSQRACCLDSRESGIIQAENDWRKESCLERWSNLFQDARELQRREVCEVPAGLHLNGTQRRLCYGASSFSGSEDWQTAARAGSSASCEPRFYRQQPRDVAVCKQPRPQTIRSRTSYQTTLARVRREQYTGIFFCPTVSTGAFVARRDGKVFITGNSGFPKSLDISKAIDKSAGVEREVIGDNPNHRPVSGVNYTGVYAGGNTGAATITAPATAEAQLWSGYGTALKPAFEPIIIAMNPLDGTFASNALKHGVAGLNIDGCRIPTGDNLNGGAYSGGERCDGDWKDGSGFKNDKLTGQYQQPQGRFPANLIHDGSDEVLELFPQSKDGIAVGRNASAGKVYGGGKGLISQPKGDERCGYGGNGSAARFFYCSKASKSERGNGNSHATVKPLSLMEYLCKLVKMPEYNLILDPFMGSGTTLLACGNLGIKSIGIESDEKSCEIARQRCIDSCVKMLQSGTY